MKTVKFYTLGCKVNQYDTQEIREGLLAAGFQEVRGGGPAGVCVINTCTVTSKTDTDSLACIRKAQAENPRARIVVTGCLAELDASRIRQSAGVSLVVANKDKSRIAGLIAGKKFLRTPGPSGISYFEGRTRAFLKIQDGCDNFCSYCKVPLARGRSRSRELAAVTAEAGRLSRAGFREIVLCGICLGAYGRDLTPARELCDVVKALEGIPGLARVRLSSIEAGDVSPGLVETIKKSSRICRHLHIPIQSGDDTILGLMNRRYRRADYLGLIRSIRRSIPGIAITTDVLVGFPGETEEFFSNTLDCLRSLRPSRVHVFPYSRREGTRAAGMSAAAIDPGVIKARVSRLKEVCAVCTRGYIKRCIGKSVEVLIEEPSAKLRGFWEGYTDTYIRVALRSRRDLRNHLVAVTLRDIRDGYAIGVRSRKKRRD